jgi:hypothetical protein
MEGLNKRKEKLPFHPNFDKERAVQNLIGKPIKVERSNGDIETDWVIRPGTEPVYQDDQFYYKVYKGETTTYREIDIDEILKFNPGK